MTRVTNIDAGRCITTGLLNMRRFEQRPTETLVIGQMLDRKVDDRRAPASTGTVYDVAMEQARTRDWVLSPGRASRSRRQGLPPPAARPTSWSGATSTGLHRREEQPGRDPPDRRARRDAPGRRRQRDPRPAARAPRPRSSPRSTTSGSPTCSRSCPRRTRSRSSSSSTHERAADVLEEMSPDDAADLIADLPPETAADAARADGARRGRGRPPADVLRRGDRRRHDDARAGDPRRRTRPSPRRWRTSATRS